MVTIVDAIAISNNTVIFVDYQKGINCRLDVGYINSTYY